MKSVRKLILSLILMSFLGYFLVENIALAAENSSSNSNQEMNIKNVCKNKFINSSAISHCKKESIVIKNSSEGLQLHVKCFSWHPSLFQGEGNYSNFIRVSIPCNDVIQATDIYYCFKNLTTLPCQKTK